MTTASETWIDSGNVQRRRRFALWFVAGSATVPGFLAVSWAWLLTYPANDLGIQFLLDSFTFPSLLPQGFALGVVLLPKRAWACWLGAAVLMGWAARLLYSVTQVVTLLSMPLLASPRPLFYFALAWALLADLALIFLLLWPLPRARFPLCSRCEYDLRASLDNPTCPECGTPLNTTRWAWWRAGWRPLASSVEAAPTQPA